MSNTTPPTVQSYEKNLIIEGLRKLALQRDTLRKYASDEESDSFDEDRAEQYAEDIDNIRTLLVTFGDTKPLVTKTERRAIAKKNAKAKAKALKVTVTKADIHAKSNEVISALRAEGKLIIAEV